MARTIQGCKRTKSGSVQASFVPVREIKHDTLCLYAPGAPGQREHRAVLEVSGFNYSLRSESEQRAINDVFQHFLAGLTHPLQVLIRILPLDIGRHLQQFRVSSRHPIFQADADAARWLELAMSYVQFWHSFASAKTLLDRHFYIIVPADTLPSSQKLSWSALFPGFSKVRAKDAFDRAKQQLDLRCSEIARQLAALGLEVQRLAGDELAQFEYSCLSARRARSNPLQQAHIQGSYGVMRRADRVQKNLSSPTLREQWGQAGQQKGPEPVMQQEARARRKKPRQSPEDILHWPNLADVLAPAGARLAPDSLYIEGEYNRVLAVRGLPRYAPPGWLNPLVVELDEPLDISLFFEPRPSGPVIHDFQRRLYEMKTSEMLEDRKGRLHDPNRDIVQGDVQDLITKLASGEERMLDVSMYVLLRGASKQELNERTERVQSVLNSMLLHAKPALFEQDRAYLSCMPHMRNELRVYDSGYFTLPASIAATFFMFLSNTLTDAGGILEGITDGQEPLLFDRWSARWRNAHRMLIAPTGSGKSFKVKQDILRLDLLYNNPLRRLLSGGTGSEIGLQQIIVDIEREFLKLTKKRGGQWVRFAPGSNHHINMFDLPRGGDASSGDMLADQIQFIHGALEMMLSKPGGEGIGTLTDTEKALLDSTLYYVYQQKGITSDPATHDRQPPLLRDLYDALEHNVCGQDTTGLASRLRTYVLGSLSGLFSGYTNVSLDRPIIDLDIRDLAEKLRPIALYLISHFVWSVCIGSRIPRHLVLDEMQSLLRYPEGKKMIEEMFQRGRKHFLSITGIVQSNNMLVDTTLAANCQMTIIMAHEPAAQDAIARFVHLSEPELALVKRCRKGDGVMIIGDRRYFVHFAATEQEYQIATTDPRDLERMEKVEEVSQSRPKAPPPNYGLADQKTAPMPAVDREATDATDKMPKLVQGRERTLASVGRKGDEPS